MHLDDGEIRAYIDNALDLARSDAAAEHLSRCAGCERRRAEAAAQAAQVDARLRFFAPSSLNEPSEIADARAALQRFKLRRSSFRKESPVLKQLSRPLWRGVAIAAAAVLIAAVLFSFEPVQVWAGQFLGLFRVKQVAVLPVDTTGLNMLNGNTALAEQISQLISKSTTVVKKPGEPKTVGSAAQASQLAGFAVRLPSSRTDQQEIRVQDGGAFRFVVDRARAQSLLDATGHKDLVLPASLDGATIAVTIPAAVNVSYGNCPTAIAVKEGQPVPTRGSAGRRMGDCVMLVEMPSPSAETPPDLDIQQLAQIGLEFTGMTPAQAKAYSETVDWTSTLVIPVPRNGSKYEKVNVDGAQGYLIQRPVDDVPGYALVWVKNGIIHAIAGMNNDTATAIQMANSLK